MARFNLNGFLDNSRFEDFFARFGGGSADHDHLNGTTGSNTLFGGASEDTLAGMAGNDTLNGGSGADKRWGGFGNDVIKDFDRAQGDKIEISAHTAEVKSIEYKDSNGDGKNDYSVITVISQQGNAGAHDEDLLGTITVYGNLVKASDITTTQTVYGAYEKVGELGAGVHFELEDDGVLANGGTDGGHHNEATAMANMHM